MGVRAVVVAAVLSLARAGLEPCVDHCDVCAESGPACSACVDGAYKEGNACLTCPAGCSTCTGTTDCTACDPEFTWGQVGGCVACPANCANCDSQTESGICNECNAGFHVDPTGQCAACPANCASCSDPVTCVRCHGGFTALTGSDCVPCKGDSPDLQLACTSCSGPTDSCVSCADGFFLDVDRCQKCSDGCKTCGGAAVSDCTACMADTHFLPPGSSPSDGCSACSSAEHCEQCLSSSACVKCANGATLSMGTCTKINSNGARTRAVALAVVLGLCGLHFF